MERIDLKKTAGILNANDSFLILTHRNPDGDTLGSGFALMYILRSLGKTAKVQCCDKIPAKYSYMYSPDDIGEPDNPYVVAVDVADEKLLGSVIYEKYQGKVKLCIDHHVSNKEYAETLLLRDCAAASEIIFDLANELGVEIDKRIANCIYTGISTDTGCFRFANVTAYTHEIAAKLIEKGADFVEINKAMFETKTKGYFQLEAKALESLEMYFDGKCAVMTVTQDALKNTGTDESDCDGIAAIPRKIEGVLVGVTVRERTDGTYKVSLRSHAPVDCTKICTEMGGGGHARAAGCDIERECFEEKKAQLLSIIKREIDLI